MSERSERLAASEASLAEKVVWSTTNQLVNNNTANFRPFIRDVVVVISVNVIVEVSSAEVIDVAEVPVVPSGNEVP